MDDASISREDLINLKKSMKDPKFKELLGDYMLEISDPGNKQENDAYLRQLENEGELPKSMKLIQPLSFFCLLTKIASNEDKKFTQKIYINVCTNSEVEKARQNKNEEQKSQWSVPYFLGKQRYDQDTGIEKEIVCVIDIVFHSDIVSICAKIPNFQKMICDISFEAVNKTLNAKKESLDPNYTLVKGFSCKGKEPSLLPIRDIMSNDSDKNLIGEKPKLFHEINKMKEEATIKEASKIEKEPSFDESETVESKQREKELHSLTPKYSFSYVYVTDSDDFIESSVKNQKAIFSLKLKVSLPKVSETIKLKCDFKNSEITLSYEQEYFLQLTLPIDVEETKYKAKYDKSKKELNLEFFPKKKDHQSQNFSRGRVSDKKDDNLDMISENGCKGKYSTIENNRANVECDDQINRTEKNNNQIICPDGQENKVENHSDSSKEPNNTNIGENQAFLDETREKKEESNSSRKASIQLESEVSSLFGQKTEICSNKFLKPIPIFNQQRINFKTFVQLQIKYKNPQNIEVYISETSVLLLHKNMNYFYAQFDKFEEKMLEIKFLEDFVILIFSDLGEELKMDLLELTETESVLIKSIKYQTNKIKEQDLEVENDTIKNRTASEVLEKKDALKAKQINQNSEMSQEIENVAQNYKFEQKKQKEKSKFCFVKLNIRDEAFVLA